MIRNLDLKMILGTGNCLDRFLNISEHIGSIGTEFLQNTGFKRDYFKIKI